MRCPYGLRDRVPAASPPAPESCSGRLQRSSRGGAGSSARTVKFGWKPYPPFIAEGTGSHLVDVDGNDYVDYLLGLGPDILGHRHPVVTRAVADAIERYGTSFGLPYELEVEAARKVVAAVPSLEMVRFTNSGSEAATNSSSHKTKVTMRNKPASPATKAQSLAVRFFMQVPPCPYIIRYRLVIIRFTSIFSYVRVSFRW